MKVKFKKLYYILMFLPLIVTLISLFFLPDTIPAHFSTTKVDRFGSKYETLIFPLFTIPFGYFLLVMGKSSGNAEINNNNEQISLITSLCSLSVFNALCYYFLYIDFRQIKDLKLMPVDLNSLIFTILGISLIILGNYMPRLKLNSLMGLRNSWSMKNETTWKKSQKFGGVSFIILGVMIVIGNVFIFHGVRSFFYTILLFVLDLIISVIYTYFIAKKYPHVSF